jgi:hypothetical protein
MTTGTGRITKVNTAKVVRWERSYTLTISRLSLGISVRLFRYCLLELLLLHCFRSLVPR